ncbi:MAG: outer membrane protein assembly factor BamB family protein [Planctomycetota bacterium]
MGDDDEDREVLRSFTVSGPCVVSDGLVLGIASRYIGNHNVVFFALDASTGKLVWMRPLGWGQQELNLFGAPVKELAASAPAVSDGVAYASTGLGFTAAVDVRTGRPHWLASYEIQDIEPVQYWFKAPLRFPRVGPSPPVVAEDLLLLAPTDGTHLYAYDRADGRVRWRIPYPDPPSFGATSHFLGVVDDGKRNVALLAGSRLEAYDLETGALLWYGMLQEDYEQENYPVGRGVAAGGQILVPTVKGLVRFSLEREGSFVGRDPWPPGATPGNVIALPQVLLVAARESLQAFYSWEEIEEDIRTRRRERPDDPAVLLEAGEIYRLGGALDRAESTFREALRMAEAARDAAAVARAEHGLFLTFFTHGKRLSADAPPQAIEAYHRALEWARNGAERVEARIRIDTLLTDEPAERAENLQRLVSEAHGVRAAFPGSRETLPARAMALLQLARVQLERGLATDAVDALQVLLREEGETRLGEEPARDRARRMVDEILQIHGGAPYAQHEAEAERLLAAFRASEDLALLERILREYPNATVVPEALFRRGARLLADRDPGAAAETLLRLLRDGAEASRTAPAAALLSRAYRLLGREGARRFALTWLRDRYADHVFTLDDGEFTGYSFAAAEGYEPTPPEPEEAAPRARPLRELHFERVPEDSWGREVEVVQGGEAQPPLALLTDNHALVAFDLKRARVAFRLSPGACHRALHVDGTLVLALTGALRGVSADGGRTRWDTDIDGYVVHLAGARGQVYALVQDATGAGGGRRLMALDATTGRRLWSSELGNADYRTLLARGPDLLLRQSRYEGGHIWPAVVVLDGLTGHTRHVIALPTRGRMQGEPTVVGSHLVVASRDEKGNHQITGHDIETGALEWTRPLAGRERVTTLVPDGDRVLVLQSDGHLGTYDARTGEPTAETKITVGSGSMVAPYQGTVPLAAYDRVTLMLQTRQSPYGVAAWDRRTGKLIWESNWTSATRLTRAVLHEAGPTIVSLTAYDRRGAPARVLLRVLETSTGDLVQEVEPEGLAAEHGLLSMAEGWGTIVVFGRAGAALYAPAEQGAPGGR